MKNTSRKPYIYKVTNLENHQYYIGSQCSGKKIGVNYFTSSTNKEFWEDFKTYGEEKYKIEIIKAFGDPDECVHVENYIIRNYMLKKDGLCLNRACCCGGKKIFSMVGLHHSEDARKRMSEALKGRPAWNKGRHLNEETRKKISEAGKGRNKGIPRSAETKLKLSLALKGRPSWNKGIPTSEETRKKMSVIRKGRPSLKKRKISIEGVVFESLTEASKYYNVVVSTIIRWIKNKKHNSFYVI